ncbi:enoyl-CoA hydratase/isomerase family protein [Chloroflexota bacterium]
MSVVLYEKKGRIAYITLNRPEKLNAISFEVAEELRRIWQELMDDDNLWVAVLTGAGESFCAGADLGYIAAGEWKITKSVSMGNNAAGPSTCRMWKPVIAALKGRVLGAGFWLSLECDIRVAADDTLFGLPEPKVGVPTIVASLVPRHIPMAIANELLLLGESITARRAYEVGLINRVVPPDKLMDEVTAIAEKLCHNAPLSLRAIRALVRQGNTMDYNAIMALVEHICTPVMNSQDRIEGVTALKEKRKPVWQGR